MNKGDFKMIIEIIDETEVVPESHQELVHKVVSFAADFLKIPQTEECSISFVSSERIREINRDFRNIKLKKRKLK